MKLEQIEVRRSKNDEHRTGTFASYDADCDGHFADT